MEMDNEGAGGKAEYWEIIVHGVESFGVIEDVEGLSGKVGEGSVFIDEVDIASSDDGYSVELVHLSSGLVGGQSPVKGDDSSAARFKELDVGSWDEVRRHLRALVERLAEDSDEGSVVLASVPSADQKQLHENPGSAKEDEGTEESHYYKSESHI